MSAGKLQDDRIEKEKTEEIISVPPFAETLNSSAEK